MASRLLPLPFIWCLFWNWIHQMGQSLCSDHGSLPGRAKSYEKTWCQEQFWGTGGWVSSWGSLSPVGRGSTTSPYLLHADLVCGPLEVKSQPERGAQICNVTVISASIEQPPEWREEGRQGKHLSYVPEGPHQGRLSSTHFYSTFFSSEFSI